MSCGPGEASGWPWKQNAGLSVRAKPCSVPSNRLMWVARRLAATLPANVKATHRSLFDGSLQGIEFTDRPAYSFQGHPEASPGPREMSYLFDKFVTMMEAKRKARP